MKHLCEERRHVFVLWLSLRLDAEIDGVGAVRRLCSREKRLLNYKQVFVGSCGGSERDA